MKAAMHISSTLYRFNCDPKPKSSIAEFSNAGRISSLCHFSSSSLILPSLTPLSVVPCRGRQESVEAVEDDKDSFMKEQAVTMCGLKSEADLLLNAMASMETAGMEVPQEMRKMLLDTIAKLSEKNRTFEEKMKELNEKKRLAAELHDLQTSVQETKKAKKSNDRKKQRMAQGSRSMMDIMSTPTTDVAEITDPISGSSYSSED